MPPTDKQTIQQTPTGAAVAGFLVRRFLTDAKEIRDTAKVLLEELELETEKDNHTKLIELATHLLEHLVSFSRAYPVDSMDGHPGGVPLRQFLTSVEDAHDPLESVIDSLKTRPLRSKFAYQRNYRKSAEKLREPFGKLIRGFDRLLQRVQA